MSDFSDMYKNDPFFAENKNALIIDVTATISNNPNNASVHSVKRSCPLTLIPDFNVATSFPPDIMHDVLEGCIPPTVQLVLQHLYKCKAEQFNNALRNVKPSVGHGAGSREDKSPGAECGGTEDNHSPAALQCFLECSAV